MAGVGGVSWGRIVTDLRTASSLLIGSHRKSLEEDCPSLEDTRKTAVRTDVLYQK